MLVIDVPAGFAQENSAASCGWYDSDDVDIAMSVSKWQITFYSPNRK